MTDKIYLADSYKKEADAKVVAKDRKEVKLDRTIFYPTGGGVPCDTGTISHNGIRYNVIETKKVDDEVVHVFGNEPEIKIGDQVECKIDWERRYGHMRYHTATHVVAGIAERNYSAMYVGGQIHQDKARFDFDIPDFNKEKALKMIEDSQKIIDANLDIVVKFLTKEEAAKIPNLARTAPGRELIKKLESVRIVEIVGFDLELDGGPHVANTRELGKLELSNFENKGSRRKRIEIMLK